MSKINCEIKLKIKDVEIVLTQEEANELYEILKSLLNKNDLPSYITIYPYDKNVPTDLKPMPIIVYGVGL
jgi:hypothetical protein